MTVIRTFISHADADEEAKRFDHVLRKLAPLGVRPWLDSQDMMNQIGGSLSKAVRAGITQQCQTTMLFLSKESVKRPWVEKEVNWALEQLDKGHRIISVFLDDPKTIGDLSEPLMEALGQRSSKPDNIYLKVGDETLPEKVATSVFSATGLDKVKDVVLHLGHRQDSWDAQIPEPWCDLPALDIRLNFPVGSKDYSPTVEDWVEMQNGFTVIRRLLPKIEKIRVCGFAPLGVGALVGHIWDRGTRVQISCWNEQKDKKTGQEWQGLAREEEQETENWNPDNGDAVILQNQIDLNAIVDEVVVALMYKKEQADHSEEWSKNLGKPWVWFKPTRFATSPDDAENILKESIGAIRWIIQTYPQIKCMNIITGLPLAMMPLLVQQLKRYRKMRFFDQIYTETDSSKMYREAVTWT